MKITDIEHSNTIKELIYAKKLIKNLLNLQKFGKKDTIPLGWHMNCRNPY